MGTSDIPVPQKGFLVAHFLTVKDQAKSKEFYVGVLGGKIVKEENPCYIKLENSWSASTGFEYRKQLPQSARRRHSRLL